MTSAATPGLESHTFEFSAAFLTHTVNAQSSTLGKAALEAIMNGIDADATKIILTLTPTGLSIVDDGHGFRSREEILANFKVFGFDHAEHQREFGRFGIGRAQLFAFGATKWRTHTFLFDVNVRERGFNWLLGSEEPHVDGLTIDVDLYKPMSNLEMVEFRNELEQLVRYSEVPVILNGEQLSKAPSESNWTLTTDEAYVRVTEGYSLSVYNQGIFVAKLYSSSIGLSGTVVTKRGHALSLNVSRNEIMRATCPVWAKIKPRLAELSRKPATKRLNDNDRAFLALQTAEPEHVANFERPIFTLSTGKHVSLSELMRHIRSDVPLTVSESGNRMAEALIRDKTAMVLAQGTLERFAAESIQSMLTCIRGRLLAAGVTTDLQKYRASGLPADLDDALRAIDRTLSRGLFYEAIADCPGFKMLNASKIEDKNLSPQQRIFLRCLESMRYSLGWALTQATGNRPSHRDYIMGRGEGIEAYTDGQTYIAVVDAYAEKVMKMGLPGFLQLAHVMVHEYLHDHEDSGSHAHDLQFMETFHNIVCDHGAELFQAATAGFNRMVKETGKLSRRDAKAQDAIAASEKITGPQATAAV